MNIRHTLLAGALLMLLCVSCSGVTIIENAAISKGDDPRLDQPVSLTADGLPLERVLAQLSATTGVVLNAGENDNDWWVRDRKVIVSVKDMELHSVLRELAGILRFHWSRGGEEGKWTYRIWQDAQQRAEEDSLRAAREDSQLRMAREKRQNALSDIANLAALSAADASGLKTTDPWRYVLATEPLGRDVAELFGSFADARNAFLQGTEAIFPAAQLPPELQSTVRRIAQSYDGLLSKIGGAEDHAMLLDRLDTLQVTINRRSGRSNDVLSSGMLGRITIGSGADMFEIPILDPASPVGKAIGRAIVSLQAGEDKDAVGKRLQAEMETAAEHLADPEATAPRDIVSDPALRVKVKLFDEPTIAPLPTTLLALASKTGLAIIADYFPGEMPTVPSEDRPLGQQLEMVRISYGYDWEKAGGVLRFRDSKWFVKRAQEVPEVWIRYWTERARINKALQLSDLAQIASLLDEQIDATIMKNPDLVRFGAGDAAANRQILRFYGLLNQSQKTSLASGQLKVSDLNADQWAALQRALATKGASYTAVERAGQYLKLTQSGLDIVEYEFSYFPGNNEPAVTFTVASGAVYLTREEAPPTPERN